PVPKGPSGKSLWKKKLPARVDWQLITERWSLATLLRSCERFIVRRISLRGEQLRSRRLRHLRQRNPQCLFNRLHIMNLEILELLLGEILVNVHLIFRRQNHVRDSGTL